MPTPTTSLQILNDIRDTIGNLVERHKTLSTAETTTPADLKEIDKELGDCLNLLLSVDTGLSALMSNDFNLMLQNGNTMVSSIEQKIELITTALNAFDEAKITALQALETEKQQSLIQFGENSQTVLTAFDEAKTTALQALETEKQQSLTQFGQSTQIALNAFDEAKTTALQALETEKQQSLIQFGENSQTVLTAFDEAKTTAFQALEAEKEEALSNIVTVKGDDGLTAYEVALENGYVGTEAQWLLSLKGVAGTTNYNDLTNKPKFIKDDVVIGSGNLNDLKVPFTAHVGGSVLNIPLSNRHYSVLCFGNSTNVVSQIAIDYIDASTYVRSFNTTWSAWLKIS